MRVSASRTPLLDIEPDPAVCMTDAARLLHTLAGRIAGDWLTRPVGQQL
jgi:hypothetical protein